MPHPSSTPAPAPQPRGFTLIAAALLLAALGVVVLYTGRGAFLSPLALVVIAAIGVAALLLQLRLRPDLSPAIRAAARGPRWLTAVGVIFAIAAVFADFLHLNATLLLVASLVAVVSFGVSGVILLSALRKPRG